MSNEWGGLVQGNYNNVWSTGTIQCIFHNHVPNNKKVNYASFACDHRLLEIEEWHVRLVIGGNKLSYQYDTGSPAENLLKSITI